MSSNPNPAGLVGFTLRFTSCITFWNHAEMVAKQIAQLLLGESSMSMALTAELGNRTLCQAIDVASHEMGEIGEHLKHFTIGYSRMLGYRNFYVHSLFATLPDPNDPEQFAGMLHSLDGKGRVRFFQRSLTGTELDLALESIHALIGYGAAIQKALGATGDGIDRLEQVYGASLEKPSWPKDVEKTPLYLQGQEPPPPEPSRKRETRKAKGKP